MPAFSRDFDPVSADRPNLRTGIRTVAQSGPMRSRTTTARGRGWSETYDLLRAGVDAAEAFISQVEYGFSQMVAWDVTHPMLPGSGLDPGGTGDSGVTVSGADQTGDTLDTTGWTASTTVVKKGDFLSVDGVSFVLEAREDATSDGSGNATITLVEPIFVGGSPADGASVTTTGVTFTAEIVSHTPFHISGARLLRRMTVEWQERVA